MNIFFLTETESGCYKWRGAIPAKYLERRGHRVQIFSGDMTSYEAPDVMVFFRAHYPNVYKLVDFCKRNSIRVVFDTDDALDLVPRDNVNYQGLQSRLDVYQFLLEEADIVTTTTPTLAAYLGESNPHVAVLPNSVDPDEWRVEPRGSSTRVGWSGDSSHFADLAIAVEAVRELQKKHDFTLVLQGICQDRTLDEFQARLVKKYGKPFTQSPLGRSLHHLLTRLAGVRYEFHPSVPFQEHAKTVCGLALDIGVAPLLDSAFNRHKSCIKYYEYAMSGAVTVASNVLPYSAEVPTLARNNRETWKSRLEEALTSDRKAAVREQREWVLANRNMRRNVEMWERVYAGEEVAVGPPAGRQAAVPAAH